MSDCKENVCTTHSISSDSQTKPAAPCKEECPCPVETSAQLWSGAFYEAMCEVKRDILKDKIRKAWGPQLDKVGDAVVEAMGTKWQSMLAQGKAQKDLRDNIAGIFYPQGK